MSYVLDALRRAEAERQRGSVPGLHAQSGPAPQASAPPAPRPAWRLPAVLVLALAAGALLAWWWWPTPTRAPAVVALPPPAPPPLVSLPAPPPAARPATPRPPTVAAPQAAATVEPASAAARVLKLQELPDTLRRQIPPLAFGGATDSPERSARMLIINGQIWREGDELSPGLKLERIALRGAIFRFREQRFELSY